MSPPRIITVLLLSVTAALCSAAPTLPGIGEAMDALIAQNEIAGAVTVVLPAFIPSVGQSMVRVAVVAAGHHEAMDTTAWEPRSV